MSSYQLAFFGVAALLSVATLLGCGGSLSTEPSKIEADHARAKPAAEPAEVLALNRARLDFAVALYRELAAAHPKTANVITSPVSAAHVLSALYGGARGERFSTCTWTAHSFSLCASAAPTRPCSSAASAIPASK